MLERLIEFFVNNKFMVLLFTAIVAAWGIYSLIHTPIDAIPDLSDVQVIIISEWMGQSPQEVEDQVTFPLTSAMLSVPKVTTVRGYSYFGFSLVYIIFEDGTDIYWARSRVLEYMNQVASDLPGGVKSSLGPDATGVGWVYQYVVEPLEGRQKSLAELRSIQDWYIRYQLATVPGVAEVAPVGGFVMQYQVNIDPDRLLAYNIPINKIMMAIRDSNKQAGARLLEMSGTEYMVRGLGYIENLDDLKNVVVGHSHNGTPILVKDIGYVQRGPDLRRGLAEKDGKGEAVGGIVVMRFGENALEVINKVKQKIEEIKPGLEAEGVKIVPVYDRSSLIHRAIETLIEKLVEESIIVALVCMIFLWHFRSAFVAILTLPIGILISLIIMKYQGLNANIMSLGGIAIAIGAMIDAAIVMIENAHKLIEHEGETRSRWEIMIEASRQVGPALFFSLLIITVSFLPVFTLEAQEGRLFKPLAFTKTYAMAAAALLSITLVPVLMGFLIRGKITPEEKNPINRFLIWAYRPMIRFVLRFPWVVILMAILVLLTTYYPLKRLGSEFMPSLNEGDVLYMPTTRPGISITEARSLLQTQDKILADKTRFPEVITVFGKIGRAETATDPAPLAMVETTITLKQPPSSFLGGLIKKFLFKDEEPSEEDSHQDIRSIEEVSQAMLKALDFPGVRNAYPEGPIKTRIDMQATGIKTPVGIKVTGDDLQKIQDIAEQIGRIVQDVPGTTMVYPDRIMDGNYVNFEINREEAARYGLTVGQIQSVIASAIGGMNITTTVEGRERYPVNIRYARELREDIDALKRVFVPTMMGQQIPLGQLADICVEKGPAMIKSENAMLQAIILVDKERDIDVGTYVKHAKAAVDEAIARGEIELPGGYNVFWSGQYEYMQRAQARLRLIVPITVGVIFLLLYFNFKSVIESLIVMLSLPFAIVGGIWLMYLMNFDMSIAVGVGFIALAGVAAETGVIMLVFLDLAYKKRQEEGPMTKTKLYDAIMEGAVLRVRPKMMTVVAIMGGLLPLFWGAGTGSRVMRRIAAPMVGGMVSSTVLTLIVIPAIYMIWKRIVIWREKRKQEAEIES